MDIKKYTLENAYLKVVLLDIGATIYEFIVKSKNRNIVLTSKDVNAYKTKDGGYFGATVGRVAGRIGNAHFLLDGHEINVIANENETNSLHGGDSYAFKTFKVGEKTEDKVNFSYLSINGEGGYPGTLSIQVTYRLEDNKLIVDYEAHTTAPTLINLTNHSYFNLNGSGNILDHQLFSNVDSYYEHDEKQLNAVRKDASSTVFNFRNGPFLREIVFDTDVQQPPASGLDHLVAGPNSLILKGQDLSLKIDGNYEGFQLYSTNFPADTILLHGKKTTLHEGLAIEPVDLVIKGLEYPNLVLRPEELYKRTITYTLSEDKDA